jgi:hypothetical protein
MQFMGFLLGLIPGIQFQLVPSLMVYSVVLFFLNPQVPFKPLLWSFGLTAPPQLVVVGMSSLPFKFGKFWQPLTDSGVFFGPIVAWFRAIGLFAVLSLTLPWVFLDRRQSTFFGPSVAVFFVANLIVVDGHPRFSFEVLYPLWVSIAVPALLVSLRRLYCTPQDEQLQGVTAAFALLSVIAMSLSGVVGIGHQIGLRHEIWDLDIEDAGEWIVARTPRKAIFVSYFSEFEVASTFAGRAVYTGDPSDLRAVEVARLFAHPDEVSLVPQASYLIESKEFSTIPFPNSSISSWQRVYKNSAVTIYERKN